MQKTMLTDEQQLQIIDQANRSIPQLVEEVRTVLGLELSGVPQETAMRWKGDVLNISFDITEIFRQAPLGSFGEEWIHSIELVFSVNLEDGVPKWTNMEFSYDHDCGSNGYSSRKFRVVYDPTVVKAWQIIRW